MGCSLVTPVLENESIPHGDLDCDYSAGGKNSLNPPSSEMTKGRLVGVCGKVSNSAVC